MTSFESEVETRLEDLRRQHEMYCVKETDDFWDRHRIEQRVARIQGAIGQLDWALRTFRNLDDTSF